MFGALLDLTGVRTSCFMLLYGTVCVSLVWMHYSFKPALLSQPAGGLTPSPIRRWPVRAGGQPAGGRPALASGETFHVQSHHHPLGAGASDFLAAEGKALPGAICGFPSPRSPWPSSSGGCGAWRC